VLESLLDFRHHARIATWSLLRHYKDVKPWQTCQSAIYRGSAKKCELRKVAIQFGFVSLV